MTIFHCATCERCKKKYGWELIYDERAERVQEIRLFNGTGVAVEVNLVGYDPTVTLKHIPEQAIISAKCTEHINTLYDSIPISARQDRFRGRALKEYSREDLIKLVAIAADREMY